MNKVNRCGTRQLNIVIAEDDSALRKMYVHFLQRGAADVEITCHLATDGQDALHKYAGMILNGEIDCLITDVQMPHKDGYALAQLARSLCPSIPVVFLTGNVHDDRLRDEKQVLEKPNGLKGLAETVLRLIT